jgi:hypothetical protein
MLLICKAKVSVKCLKVLTIAPYHSAATKERVCPYCIEVRNQNKVLTDQRDSLANVLGASKERKTDGRTKP